MTIDAATLPNFEAGATLTEGQLFTIRGSRFDLWPNEIVLGYAQGYVESSDGSIYTMVLTEKNENSLVFRVRGTNTYTVPHTWNVFGTPSAPPRSILSYTLA